MSVEHTQSRPTNSPSSAGIASTIAVVSEEEEEGSRLIPPNPAILAQPPSGSILLNRNDPSCVSPSAANASLKSSGGASSVLSNVKNAFLFGETARPRQPGPPAAVFNNRNRASSASSTASTASSSGSYSGMAPQSVPGQRRTPSPCVSFAPLPQVPNLERTRSITLGVAARSNLLKTQGSAAVRMGSGASANGAALPRKDGMRGYLMMTDEEWEYYKKEKANAQTQPNPPELHHLVRDSGKKLWQKARSLSSTSSKSSSSPTARNNTLGPASDNASVTSSGKNSPPDSLNEQSNELNLLVNTAGGRPRLGLFGRTRSSSSSPHSEISEYAIDESSEIGSIAEEDEEAVEDDEGEMDRVTPLLNRYLEADGGAAKPRAESMSTTMSDGRSSAGDSIYSSIEDEEEDPPVNLPAYLQKDMGAERRHYMHEHAVAGGDGGGCTRYQSTSGTVTPTGPTFDSERHQSSLSAMSQSPSDEESHQNHLHHAHIAKHLMAMNLGDESTGSYERGGDVEGDATPRMRGSPKAGPTQMSRVSEVGSKI